MLFYFIKLNIMAGKKFFKAVFILTLFSLITRVLGFVFRMYISRQISATQLGIYQIATSIFGIFLAVVSSGLPLVISRKTAEFNVEKNKDKEQKFMLAGLIVGLAFSLACCVLIFAFKSFFVSFAKSDEIYTLLIILMPAIIFSSIYSVFRGNFWGHENYFWVCFIELIEQVSRIIITFFIINKIAGAFGKTIAITLSLSIACVLSGILAMIVYFVKGGKLKTSKNNFKYLLKTSVPITFMRVLESLVQPLITIIIPLRLIAAGMERSGALAEVGIIMGMTFPLLFIPSALVGSMATALIPEISAKNFEGNNAELKKQINSSFSFAIICAFVLIPIYCSLGGPIGTLFYNNLESGIYLKYSAFLMVPICANSIAVSTLNSLSMEIKSFRNYIVGAVLMILSIWFLPKYIGVYALAVGMGLCLITALLLNIKMIGKKLNFKINIFPLLMKLILFACFLTYITKFVFNILCKFMPLLFSVSLSSAVCILLFAILLDTFDILKIFNVFIFIKRKVFRLSKNKA